MQSQGWRKGNTTERGVHSKTGALAERRPQQIHWAQRSPSTERGPAMIDGTPPEADTIPTERRRNQRRGICGMKLSWAVATDVWAFGGPKVNDLVLLVRMD